MPKLASPGRSSSVGGGAGPHFWSQLSPPDLEAIADPISCPLLGSCLSYTVKGAAAKLMAQHETAPSCSPLHDASREAMLHKPPTL